MFTRGRFICGKFSFIKLLLIIFFVDTLGLLISMHEVPISSSSFLMIIIMTPASYCQGQSCRS